MNRHQHSLLAAAAMIAIGTALPGAASAQSASGTVTIYGLIDAAVRQVNNSGPARGSLTSMDDGIFTGSRLGFRGREDLGGGLSAVFTMESGFEPGSGVSLQGTSTADYGQVAANPRMWGREIHVGLRSQDWGLTLGRQYTLAHSIAARFQAQGNPNSTSHSLFSSHHVARQDNVLRVDAKLGGVDFSVAGTFGEVAGSSSANGSWGVAAAYATPTLMVGAYVQQMDNLAGNETRKILGLGGNYKLSQDLQLFAGAMRRSSEVSPQLNKAWTLGANYELTPNITLSAQHYKDKQSGGAALQGKRLVSWITASYRFSKRSDVYVLVDENQVDGGYAKPSFMGSKGSQTGFGFGARHRF
jgi:predicted porin